MKIILFILTCVSSTFILTFISSTLLFGSAKFESPIVNSKYIALCYHDIIDLMANPNAEILPDTITRERLIEQFNWIKQQGYQPVSWQQILDAKSGKNSLPDKAILLTFDDGYVSFYNMVFPLLKLYKYPAVISLVGSWLDPAENESVMYGDKSISRKNFLSWAQIQELDDSNLVEIASHSFDSHYGINANSYNNEEPAITTPAFSLDTNVYESLDEYRARIKKDLSLSKQQMLVHHVSSPRVIVWPYGAHNKVSVKIAADLGMKSAFTLGKGINYINDSSSQVKRYLMGQNIGLSTFTELIEGIPEAPLPSRIIHVDLDYVYDTDVNVMNHNMDILISRMYSAGIDTVYLQAFADPDGDGNIESLYFKNRHLPVRADIFNRVAWQLKTRAGVKVYAWMPVLSFDLGPEYEYVTNSQSKQIAKEHYIRLSPFSEKNKTAIKEIYTDLGAYGKFSGILFHDDAFLTDFEDSSDSAIKEYQSWGLNMPINEIRNNPKLMETWTHKKTQYLIDFTLELAESTKLYHNTHGAPLMLARNIYALPILNKASKTWFSQDLFLFSQHYDFTAVMAMPYMESAENPEKWLKNIAKASLAIVPAEKLVFELQAVNWKNKTALPAEELAKHMAIIKAEGIENFGYYPDDFISDKPDLSILRPVFSNTSKLRGQ